MEVTRLRVPKLATPTMNLWPLLVWPCTSEDRCASSHVKDVSWIGAGCRMIRDVGAAAHPSNSGSEGDPRPSSDLQKAEILSSTAVAV